MCSHKPAPSLYHLTRASRAKDIPNNFRYFTNKSNITTIY